MKKFGLVGRKLTYSYSKDIHEYFINYFGLEASYDLIEQAEFDSSVISQYDGLNITIPYKQEVIKYLDDNRSPIRAINTITKEDDKIVGYNTDIDGFGLLVEKLALDVINKVVVLGSGATSNMVKAYFEDSEVIIISRSDEKYNYDYLNNLEADLLVNTTPVGMSEFVSPIDEKLLVNYSGVIDLNYNPLNSKLSLDCKKHNVKFINGLYMLIKQAALAFEIWTNKKVNNEIIVKLYVRLLFKHNPKIALIGMPLSGKTTLIRRNNGFDLDEEIEKHYQETIPDMLKDGVFRDRETIVLAKLVNEEKQLLALGGGCILKHENVEILKDYLIVYFKVDLYTLKKRLKMSSRPLLKSKQDLQDTYDNRKDLYRKYANITLERKKLEEMLYENRRD